MKRTKSILAILLAAILLSSAVTASAQNALVLLGDADADQYVTIFDATAIQRYLADYELPSFDELAADADADGDVTVFDATEIQMYLAGLSSNKWIGAPYDGWLNIATATKLEGRFNADLEIREIYPDYFIAAPYIPMPYVILIHGSISDDWCVGDHVYCVCENVWYDDQSGVFPYRYEGDLVAIVKSTFVPDPSVAYKPVIYLYPEEETQVDVSLELNGELLISEPLYNDGWTVKAAPDGTLTDADGKTYDYLFWEAKLNADYDLSRGFCVKGADTEAFLNDALKQLGLNRHEADDFIEFWLPIMEKNPYSVISFQTDAYTDAAGLNISPQPDSVIRVFMTWYASDSAVDIPAQELTAPDRNGFTVVEWGGSMVQK